MATRSKNRRRKKSKKRSALGLLTLELIGVAAFAVLLTAAQGQRESAVDAAEVHNRPVQASSVAIEYNGDWQSHDQRFTQIIGDLWEAGF